MPCAVSREVEESIETAIGKTEAFLVSHPSPVIRQAIVKLREGQSLAREALAAHDRTSVPSTR